jgi:hypothetical protein
VLVVQWWVLSLVVTKGDTCRRRRRRGNEIQVSPPIVCGQSWSVGGGGRVIPCHPTTTQPLTTRERHQHRRSR